MQFLSIREFSKAPKIALSKLSQDGKAVLTNNGKPAAIMINVNTDSFEHVFSLVQEFEKHANGKTSGNHVYIYPPAADKKERADALERLMSFKRKKVSPDFNCKNELMEAIDERFGNIN
jgi:hypothetical protein